MSKKHVHRSAILHVLTLAKQRVHQWRDSTKLAKASDDVNLLGQAVARLADERDITRQSQQRMHKKVREQEDVIADLKRTIVRKERGNAALVRMLSEAEFAHNRRTNDLIRHHAAQITMMKGAGSFPKGTVTRLVVIDDNGRSYSNRRVKDMELSLQDDGRTLKVFVK